MRITASDIQRIIEDERQIWAESQRREETMRITGRDLRRLVREEMMKEGVFPEELEGVYGEEPPSEADLVSELWGAALFDQDTRALEDMTALVAELGDGEMLKFSMKRFEVPGSSSFDDIFITKTSGGWLISVADPEDPEALELDDPSDAANAAVFAGQVQLGVQDETEDPGIEDDIRRDEMMAGEIYESRTLRQMILREMAEILPFPGMRRQADVYTTMTGVMSALQQIQATVGQMKGAAKVGRAGVGAPAGRVAEDVVRMTVGMLDTHLEDVASLADEDEFAFDVLALLEALNRIAGVALDDPSAVRSAAMQIGRTLSMSQGIISELEDTFGMAGDI